MPVYMECPSCLTGHNLVDSLVGKKVRCKSCRQVFLVVGTPTEPQEAPKGKLTLPESAELGPASLPSELGRHRHIDDQFAGQRLRAGGPSAKLSDAPATPPEALPPIRRAEEPATEEPILKEIAAPPGQEPLLPAVAPPQEPVVLEAVPTPRRPARPGRGSQEFTDRRPPSGRSAPPRRQNDDDYYDQGPDVTTGGSRTGLVIGIIAAAVLLLAGGGTLAFFLLKDKDKPAEKEQAANNEAGGKGPDANKVNPAPVPANQGQPQQPVNQNNNLAPQGNQGNQQPNFNQPRERRPRRRRPVQPPPAEVAVWEVKVDPPKEEVNIPAEKPITLTIPGNNENVLFPSSPSKFVALGKNNAATDRRELWNLETIKRAALLRGSIGLTEPFALSPDGLYLAGVVSTQRGTVDVWSFETGRGIQRFQVTTRSLDLVDFAGPGQLLTACSAGLKKSFTIWDIKTGQQLRQFDGPRFYDARSEAFSPGRRYLALVAKKKLLVYDLNEAKLAGEKALPGGDDVFLSCQGLGFSPDGTELAGLFGTFGKSRIITWDVAKGEMAAEHSFAKDLKSEAKNAAFYKGRMLDWLADRAGWLICGQILVSRKTGNVLGTVPLVGNDFTPGPRRVIGKDHVVIVAPGPQNGHRLINVDLSKNMKADVAKGGEKKGTDGFKELPLKEADRANVRRVVVPTDKTDWSAQPDPAGPAKKALAASSIELAGKSLDIQRILFASPETAEVAVLTAVAGDNVFAKKQLRLDVYDLTTGKTVHTVNSLGNVGLHATMLTADLSPDGTVLAVRDTTDVNRLDVWSVEGKHLAGWLPYDKGANPFVGGASWAGFLDAKRLLTGDSNGKLVLWNVPECKAVYELDHNTNRGTLVLSPGRKYLALFNGDSFDLLDTASGERKGRGDAVEGGGQFRAAAAAFSPDGTQLAAVLSPAQNSKGAAVLARWDMKTGKVLSQFRLPTPPGTLLCSSPGKTTGNWQATNSSVFNALAWWGPDHVLLNNENLVDLKRKWVIWRFRLEGGGRHAGASPDERLWYASAKNLLTNATLTGLSLPKKAIDQIVAKATNPRTKTLVRPGSKISLVFEYNTGGPPTNPEEFKTKLKEELTAWLQSCGMTVEDGQPLTLAVRVAVVDSDKTFEVRDVFGPNGMRLPRLPRPRPPFGGLRRPRPPRFGEGPAKQTFKAKKLMCQFIYTDGRNNWQQIFTCEPHGGTSRKGDDPATYQLNNQWMEFSRWLSSGALPFYVARPPLNLALPAQSLLTPEGIKAAPVR